MRRYMGYSVHVVCLLAFAVLFSGVFVLDNAFSTSTGIGKLVAFYGSVGGVIISTTLHYLYRQKAMKYEATDWMVPVFAICGVLGTWLVEPWIGIRSLTLLLLATLYCCFRIFMVQHRANSVILILMFMLTGLGEAIWGLLQIYGIWPSQHALFKVTGSFFNPGPYGGYIAMVLPAAFFYLLRDYHLVGRPFHKRLTWFYIRWGVSLATVVAILLILPATMSRAAYLAALSGCAVVYLLFWFRRRYRTFALRNYSNRTIKRFVLRCLTVLLLLSVGLGFLYYLKQDSADGRVLIWKVSLAKIVENRGLGSGIGYFPGAYGEAQASYFRSGKGTPQEELLAGEPAYAFNEFVQVGVEMGFIPLVLFVAIFIYALYIGVKRKQVAAVGCLLSLLIFSTMSYPFSLMPFLIAGVFLIALSVSELHIFKYQYGYWNHYLFNHRIRRRWNKVWVIGILLGCLLLTSYAYTYSIPVYEAHKRWSNTKGLYHAQAYAKVVEIYEELYPHLDESVEYLFEYAQALSKTGGYEKSNNVLWEAGRKSSDPIVWVIMGKNYMALSKFYMAEECLQKAISMVPHRLYPRYVMAKAYYEGRQWDNARAFAQGVLDREPKVASPAVTEMKNEMEALIRTIEENTRMDKQ